MQTIPLAKLRPSSLNARKNHATTANDLAASILAHGLLQNLTVIANDDDTFAVVAGERRLVALTVLHKQGKLPQALVDGVPCLVIDNESLAREASAAENMLREAMHPADQFDAFARMVEDGKPITDIAAHFGVSETIVHGRLRLAHVAPEIVADYRDGKATLEQMMALAITDDQDAQRAAWIGVDRWDRDARRLRDALTAKEVRSTDKRARLVGPAAYEAAGGAVRRDLFATDGTAYLLDETLLDRLVADRLHAECDALLAEGWMFARVIDTDPWKFTQNCKRTEPKREVRNLTAAEQAELDALRVKRDELNEELERLEEESDVVLEDTPTGFEIDAVEDAIAAFTNLIETYTDRQKAKSGCMVHLDTDGTIKITRGLIPEGAKAEQQVAAAQGKPVEKQAPTLSADMVQRLQLHRAAAARVMIARKPRYALQWLINQLAANLLCGQHELSPYTLRPSNEHAIDRQKFTDVESSDASGELVHEADHFHALGLPRKPSDVNAWLDGQSTDQHIDLLGLLLAHTMPNDAGESIAKHFAINMADWWQPTPETYLNLVPKALLAEAVAEVAGQPAADAITAMKKDAAIAKAAEHLTGTGWLPKPLRGPGYKLRGAAIDAADPPKRKAPKKAAKKAAAQVNG